MALCQYCDRLNNWEWNKNMSPCPWSAEEGWIEHHPSYESLSTSFKEGCRLCLLLRSGLLHWMNFFAVRPMHLGFNPEWDQETAEEYLMLTVRDPYLRFFLVLTCARQEFKSVPANTQLFTGFSYRWWAPDDVSNIRQEPGLGPFFYLKKPKDSKRISFLYRQQDISPNLNLAVDWYKSCKLNHPKCGQRRQIAHPTRLLQIIKGHHPWIRLVESSNISQPYIALSHCWGERQPLRTTMENYHMHMRGIQCSNLPRSFQNTVTIANTFGIYFLWIDALCIIQDSREDWERECPQMANIYANASVTIAAADAADSSVGFLNDYPTAEFGFCELRHTNNSRDYVIIEYAQPEQTDIWSRQESRLSQRGWALQERILSSRFLSFKSDRMQWECNTCCYSEDIEYPFTMEYWLSSVVRKRPMQELNDTKEFLEYWKEIVTTYSGCKVTKWTDKLPALSGLAQAIANITHATYVAGIWRNDIPCGLTWHCWLSDDEEELVEEEMPEPVTIEASPLTYRAPSWSWVSTDREVTFVQPPNAYHDIIVISVDTQIFGLDPFGQITSGTLHVSGRLRKGIVRRSTPPSRIFGLGSIHGQNPRVGDLYFDCAESIPKFKGFANGQEYITAFLISCTDDGLLWVALALERVCGEGEESVFKRVGLIFSDGRVVEGHNWFKGCKRQAVRIV